MELPSKQLPSTAQSRERAHLKRHRTALVACGTSSDCTKASQWRRVSWKIDDKSASGRSHRVVYVRYGNKLITLAYPSIAKVLSYTSIYVLSSVLYVQYC